ncbi:MAG: hypothetical protein WC855_07525 [Thermodesulfovibrionales bacterium]
MRTAKHIRKHKIPRGLDPAIVENILWFSKFTPLEKIAIHEGFREFEKESLANVSRYNKEILWSEYLETIKKLKDESVI